MLSWWKRHSVGEAVQELGVVADQKWNLGRERVSVELRRFSWCGVQLVIVRRWGQERRYVHIPPEAIPRLRAALDEAERHLKAHGAS